MVFTKNARKPTKRKYVRKVVRKPRRVNKSISRVVKSTLLRMAEKKQQNIAYLSNILPYNASNFSSTVFPMTPYSSFLDITQGVGQQQRVGNKIRIHKLWLSGIIYPKEFNGTTNAVPKPKEIKFLFMRAKQLPFGVAANMAGLFQYGGTAIDPQNNLSDQIMPFNTDFWHVMKTKSFKVGYANYGGNGGSQTAQLFANNDFKLNHKFKIDLTSIAPTYVEYNDTGGIPQSNLIQLVMLINNADGTQSVSTDIAAQVHFSLNITYTDI